MDAHNVTSFFRRCGVLAATPRELYDFVVHEELPTLAAEDAFLEAALARAAERGPEAEHADAAAAVDHAVFMATDVPRSLAYLRDLEAAPERAAAIAAAAASRRATAPSALERAAAHSTDGVVGAGGAPSAVELVANAQSRDNAALQAAMGGVTDGGNHNDRLNECGSNANVGLRAAMDVDDDEMGDSGDGESERGSHLVDEDGGGISRSSGSGHSTGNDGVPVAADAPVFVKKWASKEEKRAHKAAVKVANRERRIDKMPKAAKRRAIAKGAKR